ncbi:SEC-C motif-containing protein [Bhargavaea ginsengi]|uniref:SEC-C motif-containing protein n=1 Tax=Bhargavaea ginsengi TaxID=426757 RepID=A0A1H6ZWV3_9BACL|nr:SEC-C metal-binding domain-containing protein [Bhargavaea ginsengi]SEJ54212.1 SEC-C motif-containing protein [Bhargavaea ginsengi]
MRAQEQKAVVGRNDPCPCGSGKKYKKCCGAEKDRDRMEREIDQDIGRILEGFFAAHPTPSELQELTAMRRDEGEVLASLHGEEEAGMILGDLYFFQKRADIWNDYIRNAAEKESRGKVRTILENFLDPLLLALRVKKADMHTVSVEDVLSGDSFHLIAAPSIRARAGDVLIGFFVRDSRGENRILPLNSLVTAEGAEEETIGKLRQAASGQDAQTFLRAHPLAAYRLFGHVIEETALPESISGATEALERFMIDEDLKDDRIVEGFFHFLGSKGDVTEGAIAGAVWHGIRSGAFSLNWSLAETAGHFGADPDTARLFAQDFGRFMDEAAAHEDSETPVYALGAGTDPMPAEFSNWQMFMHLKDAEVTDEKALRRLMEAYEDQPYMPRSAKEEAQVRAYEAYLAKDRELRQEKAMEALRLDPENADALMLLAERTEDPEEQLAILRRAAASAEQQFEPDIEIAWGYVPNRQYLRARFRIAVSLWEEGRMEEAFDELYALLRANPGDHQGARYVALSALISLGRLDEAESLIVHYEEPDADNAFFAWFRWAIERKRNLLSPAAEGAFRIAEEQNPYTVKYVRNRPERDPYPKNTAITPRSPEEARLIWTLLEKTL